MVKITTVSSGSRERPSLLPDGLPNDQQPPETLVHLELGLFHPDSLGRALFPDILIGRERPKAVFDVPLERLWQKRSGTLTELREHGLIRVRDALSCPAENLLFLSKAAQIREKLSTYLNSLALTPHARLLEAVFSLVQRPVPPEREPELMSTVESQVQLLNERSTDIIIARFGLTDGVGRSLSEVGAKYSVIPERIRQIEAKGLRRLHTPPMVGILRDYLTVPEESLAAQEFGAVFVKDLEISDSELRDLKLKKDTLDELKENNTDIRLVYRVSTNLEPHLSNDARYDIILAINQVKAKRGREIQGLPRGESTLKEDLLKTELIGGIPHEDQIKIDEPEELIEKEEPVSFEEMFISLNLLLATLPDHMRKDAAKQVSDASIFPDMIGFLSELSPELRELTKAFARYKNSIH